MVAGLEPGAGRGCMGKMSMNVFFCIANGMASVRTSYLWTMYPRLPQRPDAFEAPLLFASYPPPWEMWRIDWRWGMNLSMVDQDLHNKHDLLKQVVRLNSENVKPACYFIIVWSWFRFFLSTWWTYCFACTDNGITHHKCKMKKCCANPIIAVLGKCVRGTQKPSIPGLHDFQSLTIQISPPLFSQK